MKKDLVSTKTNGLLSMCLWKEGTPSFNIAIIDTPIRIKQICEQFNEAAQHPGWCCLLIALLSTPRMKWRINVENKPLNYNQHEHEWLLYRINHQITIKEIRFVTALTKNKEHPLGYHYKDCVHSKTKHDRNALLAGQLKVALLFDSHYIETLIFNLRLNPI